MECHLNEGAWVGWGKTILQEDGIKIYPSSREDHNKLTHVFETNKLGYYTYTVCENNALQVIRNSE